MSWTQVGSCPKCGAPIWIPSMWHGVTPPPPTYSCNCVPNANRKMWKDSTTTSDEVRNK